MRRICPRSGHAGGLQGLGEHHDVVGTIGELIELAVDVEVDHRDSTTDRGDQRLRVGVDAGASAVVGLGQEASNSPWPQPRSSTRAPGGTKVETTSRSGLIEHPLGRVVKEGLDRVEIVGHV